MYESVGPVPHPFHGPLVKWMGNREPQQAWPFLAHSFWRKAIKLRISCKRKASGRPIAGGLPQGEQENGPPRDAHRAFIQPWRRPYPPASFSRVSSFHAANASGMGGLIASGHTPAITRCGSTFPRASRRTAFTQPTAASPSFPVKVCSM